MKHSLFILLKSKIRIFYSEINWNYEKKPYFLFEKCICYYQLCYVAKIKKTVSKLWLTIWYKAEPLNQQQIMYI